MKNNNKEKFPLPAESQQGKYVFIYFVGNEPCEERIHLAVSTDGYNFVPLNKNNEIIIQQKGTKSVRDPYILRGKDGFFYIIGTDMRCIDGWTSNHALVTWRSADLINWIDETIIDIRDFGGEFSETTRAWAPQAIWDEQEKKYMVYWANSTVSVDDAAIYYAYTDDFKTMTTPKLLYARPGIQTIDADIAYNPLNGKYYMYFKHDEDQTIAYVKSDNLTGPYLDEPVIVSHASSGVEGSEIYNITGTDTYVMMMDEYGKGRFTAEQTVDFENFEKLNKEDFDYGPNPRHGSVMAITDSEYDALIEKFGI